ncbi:hypothetical protein HPB48_019320 [Haemaphysalis longicornis]|uniref:Uncharacterized protein n=1 Tax=Haemaphysalis longicornis TaxID=44386 RepID=A0A9J6GT07_HAELO|nr:hypothetical protein HPB48_019320 [Haemaphysalis longicornis]
MDEEDSAATAAQPSSADDSPTRRRRGVGRRFSRGLASCNCASYCYFSLALVLFSLGTVLTILVLDDSEQVFPNLTHMWLIGPIFISSGLMFAVKTIMHLRRETMIAYLARQHSLLRIISSHARPGEHWALKDTDAARHRGLQQRAASLPPPYEAVATGCDSPIHSGAAGAAFPLLMATTTGTEEDPPSYEEALLLIRSAPPYALPTSAKSGLDRSPPAPSSQQPRMTTDTGTATQEDLPDR